MIDRNRATDAVVVGAKDHHLRGNLQGGEAFSGHATRVNVAGVGGDHADGDAFPGNLGDQAVKGAAENLRAIRIELAGDGRSTQHGCLLKSGSGQKGTPGHAHPDTDDEHGKYPDQSSMTGAAGNPYPDAGHDDSEGGDQ